VAKSKQRRILTAATYDNVKTSFEDLLKSKEDVYHVDSTKRTPNLGKWNISPDKNHYSNLTTWIDSIIADLFEQVNSDDTEPKIILMGDFNDKLGSSTRGFIKVIT
jgi:hypothetical protein